MGFYINDITSFSNKGFDKIDFDFIDSPTVREIEQIHSRHLEGKGLRFVPRTAQILNNVVGEILTKNGLESQTNTVALYNTSDICSLEASIDFDLEVEKFGVKLANPMKIPYTLNGSTAGWIAIKNKMHHINLTVNSGRCGILSALNLVGLDFLDGETDHAIVLSAHFMGEMYKKYNQHSTFNKEVAVGVLASISETKDSLVEIMECQTMAYNKEMLEHILNKWRGHCILDTDFHINLQNHKHIKHIQSTSVQLSSLPFFINNIRSLIKKDTNEAFKYMIVDKKGQMGYVRFKIPKP